ncbi:MAG: FkbM family methyltransferase [Thiotrichales bacterium]
MTTDFTRDLSLCSAKTPEGILSHDFLILLRDLFGISTFLETGTFMGDTTEIARQIFPHVESIELSDELSARAEARFSQYENVRVHQGDSSTVLPALLPSTTGRGLLWLDAHYSEGVTAKGLKNTPILEELQAIRATGRSDFIVLIDDLRLFQPVTQSLPEDSSLHGYPSLVEIYEAFLQIDSNYNFYVFGDVALAFVEEPGIRVSDVVRACTVSRVFDSEDFPVEDLLQAEQIVAHAEGGERQVLLELADTFAANEALGLGQHYRLWQGLLAYQEGKSQLAVNAFTRSIELGLNHWRAHYYLAEAAVQSGSYDIAEKEAGIAKSKMEYTKRNCDYTEGEETRIYELDVLNRKTKIFLPDENDHIQASILKTGEFYEQRMLEDISQHLPKDGVFVDVGANIGNHSLFVSLYTEVRVYAFEPNPSAVNIFRRNIELNGVEDSVVIVECGIGETTQQASIDFPLDNNAGAASLSPSRDGDILIQPLKAALPQDISRIDVIKIDVEGMETAVINGAIDLIKRFRPLIYAEAKNDKERGLIDELLSPLGYQRTQVFNWTPTYRYEPALTKESVGFENQEQQKVKLTIFVGDSGNSRFIDPFLTPLSRAGFEVKLLQEQDISPAIIKSEMERCDIAWFEWATGPFFIANQLKKTCRTICRLHRYEMYLPHAVNVDWGWVDDLIFVSSKSLSLFKEIVKTDIENLCEVYVIPNAIDVNKFKFREGGDPFNLGSVTRIHPDKNPAMLLQIMGKLVSIDKRYTCHIAGRIQDKILHQYMVHMIDAMGLKDNVFICGEVKDIPKWLADKAFVISTSIIESQGVNILEAMASGVVPLIHNHCSDPYEFFPGELIYNSIDEVVNKIVHGRFNNKSLRRLVESQYSLEKINHQVVSLLNKSHLGAVDAEDPNPLISILIPVFNREKYIASSINSVLAQDFAQYEIVVVDDGSTDNTLDIVKQIRDSRVRIYENGRNGAPQARNRCIQDAKAPYIVWLDSDDELMPGTLQRYADLIKSSDKVDVLYGDLDIFNDSGQIKLHRYEDYAQETSLLPRLVYGNCVPNPGTLVRKGLYKEFGGYDENLRRTHDFDFWCRIGSRAIFKHSGVVTCKWRWHDSNMSSGSVKIDTSYEATVIKRLVNTVGLAACFPQLNETYHAQIKTATFSAWLEVSKILEAYQDYEGAAEATRKAIENRDVPTARKRLEQLKSHARPAEWGCPINISLFDEPFKKSGSEKPLVSCIVPTMNRPDLLVRALESLVAQSYENWEAIVVNDAGEDVREIIERVDPKGRIRYIRHQHNKGLSAARNTGIWASRGDLLCYLDDDDRFLPDHLGTLVEELELQAADFVYSEATYVHEELRNGTAVEIGRSTPYSEIEFSRDRLDITNFIPVNTWLHRRQLIEQVGFFDTGLKALEDWDMLLRFSRITDFVHLKKLTVEVYHRVDAASDDHMLSRERKKIPELHRRLYYRYPADTAQVESQRQALLASWGIEYEIDAASAAEPSFDTHRSAFMQKAISSEKLTGASLPALARTIAQHHKPKIAAEKKKQFFMEVCTHLHERIADLEKIKVSGAEFKDARSALGLLSEILDEDPSCTEAIVLRSGITQSLNSIRYQEWIRSHGLQEIDGQLFAERMMLQWKSKPSFHFVVFLLNGEEELLADTLESVASQMYPTWRLSVIAESPCPDALWEETAALDWVTCGEGQDPYSLLNEVIEAVKGDWVAFIEPGMTLEPQALLQFGDYINLQKGWQFIFSDHDLISKDGTRSKPVFKPEFNLDLLRSKAFIGKAALIQREALQGIGGFSACPDLEVHEAALKIFEAQGEKAIGHIADVLWHIPQGSSRKVNDQLLLAVTQQHLDRCGSEAVAGPGYLEAKVRVQYPLNQQPSISVILPSQNRAEFLQSCIDSLFNVTDYDDFEVIVAGADSSDLEITQLYRRFSERYGDRFRTVKAGSEFSYSRLANAGAREARGDYLLFLAAESEVVQAQWLARLVSLAARPDVGAVGARIIFPENSRINHAGLVLGREGSAGYVFRNDWVLREEGYDSRLQVDQNYSAVSGSCMMLSSELFNQVGQFAEVTFENNYADVDLCLKLSDMGLRHVWTPYSTVVQHGNVMEKDEEYETSEQQLKLLGKWRREKAALLKSWLPRLADDPAYNPNLDLSQGSFQVDNNLPRNWDTNFHDRIRVLGIPIKGGSGEYRVIQPFNALSEAGMQQCEHYRLGESDKRSVSITEIARLKPDTFVVQAAIDDFQIKLVEEIAEYMPEVHRVCTLDDLITAVPEKSSVYKTSMRHFRDSKSRLRRLLRQCDRLVVTTQTLADAYSDLIDDIQVIPNRLSRKLWIGHESLRGQGEKPRVGWVGAQQHQGDLELVFDVIKTLANEVEWVFMGMCPDEIKPYVKEYVEFVNIDEYPKTMASLNLDLAIAPLEIHAFNESKSNLRLLEYGAMGWPVVCTDIFSYRTNNAPVIRVPNETRAWIEAIRGALSDPIALAAAGDQLRQWVQEHYILEDHLIEWERALTPAHLLGTLPDTTDKMQQSAS